jgi:dCMP deaminase
MDRLNKDYFMLEMSERFSEFSKDPTTKVGAIICDNNYRVLATGYNGFSAGYPDDYSSITREEKHLISIHAEVNAILNAAKNGVNLSNSCIYASEHPCANCTAAIVNAGITRIVLREKTNLSLSTWGKSLEMSQKIINSCQMELVKLP